MQREAVFEGDDDKLYAPVRQLSEQDLALLPGCLYQTGWLKPGEPVFPCPRCNFVFCSNLRPPQCASCGLQAIQALPPPPPSEPAPLLPLLPANPPTTSPPVNDTSLASAV